MCLKILESVKRFKSDVQKAVGSSLTNVDVDALKYFHLQSSAQTLNVFPISLKILKSVP